LYDQFASLKEISGLLKTQDPVKAVEKIIEEKQQLEKKIEQLELKQLNSIKENLLTHKTSFDLSSTEKAYFIGAVVELSNADLLKKL
ncbi:hypothetical protein V3478_33205, partial [Pseudomonas aeruginosa]|uniref:hypothetical protein n=2 Tax=Gammaproteobacteria TaxID=1236 RepID=UPI002F95A5BA